MYGVVKQNNGFINLYSELDQGVQFIQKPFSIDDLAAKVREVLDSK